MANRYGLGAAEFNLIVNNDQLLQKFAQSEAAAIRSSKKIAAAIDQINNGPARSAAAALAAMKAHNDAADKAAQASIKLAQQQAAANKQMISSFVAGGAAIAGVTMTLGTLNNVLVDTYEKTYEAAQAQFRLNAVYKESAAIYKNFTNSLANDTKLLNTDLEKGISILGGLQKNYGFTSEQIQTLTKLAVDAAAVHGVPLLDAFKSIEAAMRGEGEAAEKLGFTLNANFVKNNAKMTDEQRKLFFSLTDVTRAQIIYQEALKQGERYQGAAIKRSQEAIGVIDALVVSITKLQIKLGELATGPVVGVARALTLATNQAGKFVDMLTEIEKHTGVPPWVAAILGLGALTPGLGAVALPGLAAVAAGAGPITSALERQRRARGNELTDNDAERDAQAAIAEARQQAEERRRQEEIVARNAEKDALRIVLEKREKEIKQTVDREIKEIQRREDAERERYENERARTELEKHQKQEAAKDKRDAALRAIDEEERASKKRFEDEIERLGQERDSALQQSENTYNNAKKALERETEAVRDAVNEQIRQEEIKRDRALEVNEQKRNGLIELTRQEKEAALDSIQQQIAAAQNQKEDEIRLAEDTKKGRLEKLDQEQAEREKRLERRAARERVNKENAIRAAEDEKEAQLRVLDELERTRDRARELEDRQIDDALEAELRALEERDQAVEDSFNSESDGLRDVAEARLRTIEDTQNAEEEAYRQRMRQLEDEANLLEDEHKTRLREIKDEGRARLAEIDDRLRATDALEQAYENEQKVSGLQDKLTVARRRGDPDEIARLEKEIQDEILKQQFDAQKDSLRQTRDALENEYDLQEQALQDEFEARKDYLEKTKEAEQRAYQDRKELLQREAEDIRRGLQDALDALADRKAAVIRNTEDEKRLIQDRYETLKRNIDDQRYAEDEALRKRKEAITLAYDEERRRIEDHYDNPESGVFAKLAQQTAKTKEEFDRRKKVVNDAYDDERRRIEDHYDDPETGVFAKLRQQQQETERSFDERNRTIEKSYKDEQDLIRATYDSEETGSIPALRRALQATERSLELRGEALNEAYRLEQEQIKATFDQQIKAQQDAQKDAEEQYRLRKLTVQDAYEWEQKQIYNTYDDPVNGLFKKQKDQHDNMMSNLAKQKDAWTEWGKETLRVIGEASSQLDSFVKKIEELERKGILTPGSAADQIEKDRQGRTGSGTNVRVPTSGSGRAENPNGEQYYVGFGFNEVYTPPVPGLPPRHRGVDLRLPGPNGGRGKPVGAFTDGRVVNLTNDPNGGNGIIMQQDGTGLYEYYGHFDSRSVEPGEKVKRGDIIGTLGGSGTEDWPHLHYEVRADPNGDPMGSTIDPTPYMNGLRNTAGNGRDDVEDELTILRPFGPNGPAVVLGIEEQDWFALAKKYAKKYNFSEPRTFARQMEWESDHWADDVISGDRPSRAGAIGIAQFMPDTAAALGVDPYDPIDSLKGAAKYMDYLEERYDGVRNALWAYNAGEGNLQDGIMPAETVKYLKHLDKYRNGTLIEEPTLMLGLRTGEAGIAGETGQPERLLGVNATQAYDGSSSTPQLMHIPITIGNNVIEDLWIQGIKLTVKSGRSIGLPGVRIQ